MIDDRPRYRLDRLREELEHADAPVPLDGPVGRALLEEVDAARWPRVHEGWIPTFGSVILTDTQAVPRLDGVTMVELGDSAPADARRFADGQRTFLVRDADRVQGIACLTDGTANVARLTRFVHEADLIAVRRTTAGTVDVVTPDAGLIWDGTQWLGKPRAEIVASELQELFDECDPQVLQDLLELCVQWCSPEGIGVTFAWAPTGRTFANVEATRPVPQVSLTDRAHFPALRSAVAQTDGAVLVAGDGTVAGYGATLLPSPEARTEIPPGRGTRHTSAHRYSYDHPEVVVFVVSEDTPVSVYVRGERLDVVLTKVLGHASTSVSAARPAREP